jgi:hypothetical protein
MNTRLTPSRPILTLSINALDQERTVWLCLGGLGDDPGDYGSFDGYTAWWAPAESGQPVDEPVQCYTDSPIMQDQEDAVMLAIRSAYRDILDAAEDYSED